MFKVVNYYRFSRWLAQHNVPMLPRLIDYWIRLFFSCWLPHTVTAGERLVLGYGGLSIVIHTDAIIGDGVHIDQCVTIGGNGTEFGVPEIKDDVMIGAGAKILDPITIGRGAVVGANAVVINDVPEYSVVVGVPARVVKSNTDKLHEGAH